MKGIGGQIWAVPDRVMNPTKYYLITAGTRFTAIYRAWEDVATSMYAIDAIDRL